MKMKKNGIKDWAFVGIGTVMFVAGAVLQRLG